MKAEDTFAYQIYFEEQLNLISKIRYHSVRKAVKLVLDKISSYDGMFSPPSQMEKIKSCLSEPFGKYLQSHERDSVQFLTQLLKPYQNDVALEVIGEIDTEGYSGFILDRYNYLLSFMAVAWPESLQVKDFILNDMQKIIGKMHDKKGYFSNMVVCWIDLYGDILGELTSLSVDEIADITCLPDKLSREVGLLALYNRTRKYSIDIPPRLFPHFIDCLGTDKDTRRIPSTLLSYAGVKAREAILNGMVHADVCCRIECAKLAATMFKKEVLPYLMQLADDTRFAYALTGILESLGADGRKGLLAVVSNPNTPSFSRYAFIDSILDQEWFLPSMLITTVLTLEHVEAVHLFEGQFTGNRIRLHNLKLLISSIGTLNTCESQMILSAVRRNPNVCKAIRRSTAAFLSE